MSRWKSELEQDRDHPWTDAILKRSLWSLSQLIENQFRPTHSGLALFRDSRLKIRPWNLTGIENINKNPTRKCYENTKNIHSNVT